MLRKFLFLIAFVLVPSLYTIIKAQTIMEENGIEYVVKDGVKYNQMDTTLVVVGYYADLMSDEVTIPSSLTINGKTKTVVSARMNSLQGAPLKVLNWELNANVPQGMFSGCRSLTDVNFTSPNLDNIRIGQAAFAHCTSLKNIQIADKCVSLLFHRAFMGCTSLKKVVLPESVVKINAYAFNGCISLVELDIRNKKLAASVKSSPRMYASKSPWATQGQSKGRKPGEAGAGDSRFKVKKNGIISY